MGIRGRQYVDAQGMQELGDGRRQESGILRPGKEQEIGSDTETQGDTTARTLAIGDGQAKQVMSQVRESHAEEAEELAAGFQQRA